MSDPDVDTVPMGVDNDAIENTAADDAGASEDQDAEPTNQAPPGARASDPPQTD